MGLLYGESFIILTSTFSMIHQSDRRMDRQTDRRTGDSI